MAEQRKPLYRIAITGPERWRRVAEIYPATLFPGGEDLTDRYRVRIDRVWCAPDGVKYLFLSLADALTMAGWPHQEEPRPQLQRGDRRRLLLGQADDGTMLHESVMAMTDPFQGPDGRWRVFLVGRREPALVSDLS